MDKILRYENYISSQKINEEYEIEEEAGEYKGTTYMKELAKMLGVSVVGNKIDYEGQEINFYSETEKFHIGDKDFTTPEEAYDYLTGENPEGKNSPYSPVFFIYSIIFSFNLKYSSFEYFLLKII